MWHDLYWGGKHAAGEERERAQPGGESLECSFPAASPRKEAPPGRRGSGRGRLRAAPGGAPARGFRPDGARGAGSPRPLRRACAVRPSRPIPRPIPRPFPARAAEASAAPVSAPGARRAAKPGPDGVADRTTWRRGRSAGRTHTCRGPAPASSTRLGKLQAPSRAPGREKMGKRAQPPLRLPGPEDA